ncbi:MAG: Gfo/Idh/MocA family oxidoreductase [Bryobacterales bacterium]|nr:Gfo/Idh/MocA family oxidoreductase [Bryobacterales bacterium]MDE0623472.1 Gfo/Idh/MocA family oxidoreductase [Bryobacterales bacterium]
MNQNPSRRSVMTGGLVAAAAASTATAQVTGAPRIGLIGLGNRSRAHLAAFEALGGVEVTALSDIEADRMRAAKSGPAASAELYTDYRELIADKRVQAVVITAPNYLHAEMAIAALRAGKDVLVEKPIGITYQEALRVAAAAAETGQILAVGMQRHFNPVYRKIIEAVTSGEIGKPYLFALNEYRGDWNPRTWGWTDPQSGETTPWRHKRELAGSSLLEFSVHSYAFLHEMIGQPLSFCAATGGAMHWPERTTEDNISVIAEFGDVRLQHTYSGSAPGARWQLTATGSNGSLQYDFREATIRSFGQEAKDLRLSEIETPRGQLEQDMYRDFFRAVRERSRSALHADFAIEASKLAYGAWISIDERRIVTAADFA